MDQNQSSIGPKPSDADLQDLLHDYLFLEPGSDHQQAAFEAAIDLLASSPEDCWRLIELAAAMDLTTKQATFFSAGPVEEILGAHGGSFIDRLEVAARRQAGMRTFVAGVWRGQMSDAVWGRILALREELRIDPL